MSIEIKKYEITILGELYTLVSDQNEEHIQSAACRVNDVIKEISQKAPHLEHKKTAVLAALKIASMLITSDQELKDIRSKGLALLDKLDHELPASLFV